MVLCLPSVRAWEPAVCTRPQVASLTSEKAELGKQLSSSSGTISKLEGEIESFKKSVCAYVSCKGIRADVRVRACVCLCDVIKKTHSVKPAHNGRAARAFTDEATRAARTMFLIALCGLSISRASQDKIRFP